MEQSIAVDAFISDYAIRLLVTVAAAEEEPVTIAAAAHDLIVSRYHLMKVSSTLPHGGIMVGARGRSGGLGLRKSPSEIRIGELFRATEPDFNLAICFSPPGSCSLETTCGLPPYPNQAAAAFIGERDKHTLADILPRSGTAISGLQ